MSSDEGSCALTGSETDVDRAFETIQLFGGLLATLLVLFIPITFGIGLLQRWVGPERLQRWLGGANLPLALAKGTALGAITPFCGCSTIPLLLGLIRANVRFAAVAAFMLASPLLNPYILGVVTLLFGWRVAAVYAGFAVVSTLLIAAVWERVGLHRHLKVEGYAPTDGRPVARPVPAGMTLSAGGHAPDDGGASEGGCSTGSDGVECDASSAANEPWRGPSGQLREAWDGTLALLRPMLRPMLLGLAIGALIYGAVPEGALTTVLGSSSWFTLPLAAALGLPLYLRGEAAFPIGAGLLAAGVGEGPMFAMVIAGMAASVPEVAILSGIFARRLLVAFLASVFAMAIVGGAVIPALS